MSFQAIGDLAQFMTSRRHHVSLQSQMSRLTQELSSGETANVTGQVNASFGQLSDVEHRLTVNAAQKSAGREASVLASTMQTALESVQTQLTDLSAASLLAAAGADGPGFNSAKAAAKGGLDAIVSALNVSVAGRPVFSGTDLARSPLADGSELVAQARAAISGATDAASVIAALDMFFDTPGAGFDAGIYTGGKQDLAEFRLGAGESVQLSIRADDPVLRSALKQGVMMALAGDDTVPISRQDRVRLLESAGNGMLSDGDALTALRSDLGAAEARIDRSIARVSAERTSLSMIRNEIMSIDRFEAATALEQVQVQLETIYTLTARTSRLNLVNFL